LICYAHYSNLSPLVQNTIISKDFIFKTIIDLHKCLVCPHSSSLVWWNHN
jgi:hypothetical protein